MAFDLNDDERLSGRNGYLIRLGVEIEQPFFKAVYDGFDLLNHGGELLSKFFIQIKLHASALAPR